MQIGPPRLAAIDPMARPGASIAYRRPGSASPPPPLPVPSLGDSVQRPSFVSSFFFFFLHFLLPPPLGSARPINPSVRVVIRVGLGSTGFLLGFTGFYWVVLGVYWVLLGFIGFYWVLFGLQDFYWF